MREYHINGKVIRSYSWEEWQNRKTLKMTSEDFMKITKEEFKAYREKYRFLQVKD